MKERALSNEKSFENYLDRQELKSPILPSIFLVGSLKGPQDPTTTGRQRERQKGKRLKLKPTTQNTGARARVTKCSSKGTMLHVDHEDENA